MEILNNNSSSNNALRQGDREEAKRSLHKSRAADSIDFVPGDYQAVWQQQKNLVEARYRDDIPDTILIGEHEPVITLGRRSQSLVPSLDEKSDAQTPQTSLNLSLFQSAFPGTKMIEVERGGDLTWHGPGQLVAYPIIKLTDDRRDLHWYLRTLEEAVIQTLAAFDIQGFRNPDYTGVWVRVSTPETLGLPQTKKIASVGVAVSRWVTYHGLALNVVNDLRVYDTLSPCGLPGSVMTNMQVALNNAVSVDRVKGNLLQNLIHTLNNPVGPKTG